MSLPCSGRTDFFMVQARIFYRATVVCHQVHCPRAWQMLSFFVRSTLLCNHQVPAVLHVQVLPADRRGCFRDGGGVVSRVLGLLAVLQASWRQAATHFASSADGLPLGITVVLLAAVA